MKTIKLLLLLSITINFLSCNTIKLTDSIPFKITGTTYHNWVGGQPGVSGTVLIIGVNNIENIEFNKAYFKGRNEKISIENRNEKQYLVVNFSTSKAVKDKVLVKETTTKTEPKKTEKFPFELGANEAVISYVVGKKICYYKVSNVKKTATVFYP